jgi:hypothetical protein
MNVDVYKNLHKDTWSVRDRSTGLVVDHQDHVMIKDAQFIVQPAGRARVLREQKKNVHAFIRGTLVPQSPPATRENGWMGAMKWATRVSYNPYLEGEFLSDDGVIWKEAPVVAMTPNGCYAGVKASSEAPGGLQ